MGLMKVAIIDCDLDRSEKTNCAIILSRIIPDSEIIGYTSGSKITDFSKYSGFIITGSAAHANEDIPWIKEVYAAVKEICKTGRPCLACGLGMDIVTDSFGGTLEYGSTRESGFKEVHLKGGSRIFARLPTFLKVYEEHDDLTSQVPENAKILADNEICVQAYKYKNFYCMQFHPEITYDIAKAMAERDKKDIENIMNDVPYNYYVPRGIIANFVKLVAERLVGYPETH